VQEFSVPLKVLLKSSTPMLGMGTLIATTFFAD